MRVVADENGWELVLDVERAAIELAPSTPPVSADVDLRPNATISSNAPGSGVFRKVAEEVVDPDLGSDEATMATDPAPASGEDMLDADLRSDDVRLPAPARLPTDLTGDKTRVA